MHKFAASATVGAVVLILGAGPEIAALPLGAVAHAQQAGQQGRPWRQMLQDNRLVAGVGAFADCKRGLDAVPGMREALEEAVRGRGRPFLGICVGMQLMGERGFEHGVADGLGWIPGDVVALKPADPRLKVPHMGWNDLTLLRRHHPVLSGLPDPMHGYFVHSYHLHCTNPGHRLAAVDYGGAVAAVVGRDNLIGTQFHPEKSQGVGLALIANFLRWQP